jgi:hypothetical protein
MADDDTENAAREEVERFTEREDLPSDPAQWPGGRAKYFTIGGIEDESDEAYGEGATAKLGPQIVHHEDGSATVDGEHVEDGGRYKGERIDLAVDTERSRKRDRGG